METYMEDGKKFVSYTSKELRAKRERGESKTDWARVDATTDEELEAAIAADPDDFEWDETIPYVDVTPPKKKGDPHSGANQPKGSKKPDKKVPVSVLLSPQIAAWLKNQRFQGRLIEEALIKHFKIQTV